MKKVNDTIQKLEDQIKSDCPKNHKRDSALRLLKRLKTALNMAVKVDEEEKKKSKK